MSDVISRQDAIDAIIADKIEDGLPVITDTQKRDFEVFNSSCDRHAKILKELPSAQKTGRWIQTFTGNEWIWYCSECKETYYEEELWMGGNEFPNYCPSCGAKMLKGEEDG